jgi:hypothetical protein
MQYIDKLDNVNGVTLLITGGHLKYFPGHTKNFSRDIIFFPENDKISSHISFSGHTKIQLNNAIKNQRLLGKKCNLNDIFHGGKGHFAPGKRALLKNWGVWPPGSYAPAH